MCAPLPLPSRPARLPTYRMLLCACILVALAVSTRAVPPASQWVVSATGQSCTDACAALPASPPCHLTSMQQANSLLLFFRVKDVLMNYTSASCVVTSGQGDVHGPSVDVNVPPGSLYFPQCFVGGDITTCEASEANLVRFCCCGDTDCSLDYTPRWQLEGIDVPAPALHHAFDLYDLF